MFDFDLIQWLEGVWVATTGFFQTIIGYLENGIAYLSDILRNVQGIGFFISSILDGTYIILVVAEIVSILPQPNGVMIGVVDMAFDLVLKFTPYIRLLGYVINLQMLLIFLATTMVIETILIIIRIWRFVLSMIPFA